MIYADTSILLSLFCPDSQTEASLAWYEKTDEPVCISDWTVIEWRAVLGLRVREGSMSRAKAVAAMKQLDTAAAKNFHLSAPAPDHFKTAAAWLARPECALRSADALHLAIAFGNGCKQFATFDQPLAAAGKKLRLPVVVLKG